MDELTRELDGEVTFDPHRVWEIAQEELKFQLTRPGYETWLANAKLVNADGATYTIGVPTKLARDWLMERYAPLIKETLAGILSKECDLVITVVDTQETLPLPEDPPIRDTEEFSASTYGSQFEDDTNDAIINPNFTFSTFVVGNSSRFAHAACLAVAESPGKAYNPLFIYGGVGLGKTHLMHAIGNAVRAKTRRPPKVVYVTSEKFTNEMVLAIQQAKTNEFRQKYRSVDVLLIDDIQFLAGKDRTQEEFFHTFNALYEVSKQVVVSSDRPPKDIPTLEDRLRSRFEGGLIADIKPPDFETRLAILHSKLGAKSWLVSEEVCAFMAHRIQKNIRELEGALIRVLAHASINQRAVSLEEAQSILADIIPDATPLSSLSISAIQLNVATYFGITLEEMNGKRRDKQFVLPRQVAMYLCREETDSSLPAIGAAFGGRDHTTVLHAIEKISELLGEDERLASDIVALQTLLQNTQ